MAKEGDYAQVRLPSGEVRKVSMNAEPPSAKLAIWTTPTSRSVKQEERDTWESVLP